VAVRRKILVVAGTDVVIADADGGASSGRVTRHRLNRGGDRQLNRILHVIALHRMRRDPRSRAYADRRQATGSTNRETRRCLKNYLARHLWRVMDVIS
jgi:transposase